ARRAGAIDSSPDQGRIPAVRSRANRGDSICRKNPGWMRRFAHRCRLAQPLASPPARRRPSQKLLLPPTNGNRAGARPWLSPFYGFAGISWVMLQPLQVRLKGARDVCIWHFCDITRALGGVRFRGQTGKHFLTLSFPQRPTIHLSRNASATLNYFVS